MRGYLPDGCTQADIDRAIEDDPAYRCGLCGGDSRQCECLDDDDGPMEEF